MQMKSVKLLESADVVVYDDLAAEGALSLCRDGASKLYVGKRGGQPSFKQAEIDQLLVQACTEGREVVRLKGGCSGIFSRVGSEMRALASAGVEYELVPGVSSISAAPTLAGFPLTDTNTGRSFVVSSAHAPSAIDWAAFRKIDTVVLLMGAANLVEVIDCMLSHGWEPSCEIAVIKAAGTAAQETWSGTLDTIATATAGQELSPCVIVVGRVVALRDLSMPSS